MAFIKADTVQTPEGYKIIWQGDNTDEIKVYGAADSTFSPNAANFLTVAAGGECEIKAEFSPRAYFILEAADGAKIRTAVRLIKTEKIKNFRDIGGYLAKDGARVKWGMLYRSAAHDEATANDLALVQNLGIKSVIDYRTSLEFKESPDKRAEGVTYLSNPPFPENAGAADVTHFDTKSEAGAVAGLVQCNRVLATAEESFKAYRTLFQTALDDNLVPTLQHCTAGKDRVGVGACCMLLALGVDRETVMEDYLLSNLGKLPVEKLTAAMAAQGVQMSQEQLKAMDALLGVRAEYLQAFLDTVDANYPSFEDFLLQGIGLSREELDAFRAKYLEVL